MYPFTKGNTDLSEILQLQFQEGFFKGTDTVSQQHCNIQKIILLTTNFQENALLFTDSILISDYSLTAKNCYDVAIRTEVAAWKVTFTQVSC